MSCTEVTSKKYQTRKSPAFHAGDCKGQTKKGKNGTYISKADKRGVYKWVKASTHGTQKGMKHMYLTHDNGTDAYRVLVHGNHVEIDNAETNKHIKSYKIKDIYYGISGNNKKTKGNSIVLYLGNGKYIYIGEKVYAFEIDDEMDTYFSLIGNGDVPYPVLLGKENVYFMLDNTYVPRSEFKIKMTPKMWEDAYAYYYGYLDAKTGEKHGAMDSNAHSLEKKSKKMKGFRVINRR